MGLLQKQFRPILSGFTSRLSDATRRENREPAGTGAPMGKARVYDRDIPSNCCLTFKTVTSDFKSIWHTHQDFEIVCIEDGGGVLHYGREKKPYGRGDLLALGPWVPHRFMEKSREHRSTSILFNHNFIIPGFFFAELVREIKDFLDTASSGLFFKAGLERVGGVIELLASKETGFDQAMHLLFLLKKLSGLPDAERILPEGTGYENRSYMKLQEILHYIHEHSRHRLLQGEVAREFFMSRSAFSRFFKEKTGEGFSRYLTVLRLEKACKLLEYTDRSITEIGQQAGFESISAFNRAFARFRSESPSAYRKRQTNL